MKGIIRASLAATAVFCLVPSCSTDDDEVGDEIIDVQSLDGDFAQAARTYDVPVDLLKAIAYVETQWQVIAGEEEHEGRPAGVGVFALWGDNLALGAKAAGLDVEAVQLDTAANITAAAARLAALAAERGVSGTDVMAWMPVVAAYSQNPDPESQQGYADDVLRVLASGASAIAEDGTVVGTLAPNAELVAPQTFIPFGTSDYPSSVWRPSPNYNSRNGTPVSLVVIHTCEGNYAGCWGWLRNSAAGASAHYVVKENGAEITQLVREASRAWHVAAPYQCSRAGGQQCNRNGQSTNTFSVGIEHAGFASQASFSSGMIEASAKLTCDITKSHNIVRDRNHIVAHGQLQPWNRTDPGKNWPWSHYIDRVRAHCGSGGGGGGGGGGTTIIVDSNNANNNQNVAKVTLTGAWTSSAGTPGYYGTGYWFANTAETSAPATFWFYQASAGSRTIDAWWTAGTNRSTAAPFVAYNAAGTEVGRRAVNQQGSGSQWVTLGTWNFSAGWNKVSLSRWAPAGKVVVADAIRVR